MTETTVEPKWERDYDGMRGIHTGFFRVRGEHRSPEYLTTAYLNDLEDLVREAAAILDSIPSINFIKYDHGPGSGDFRESCTTCQWVKRRDALVRAALEVLSTGTPAGDSQ